MSLDLAIDLYLRGTAVLVAALGVAWLFRRASASQRSLVQSLGFTALLVLPAALLLAPSLELEVLPAVQPVAAEPTVLDPVSIDVSHVKPVESLGEIGWGPEGEVTRPVRGTELEPASQVASTSDRALLLGVLPWIWCGVSLLLVVRVVLRRHHTFRALRRRSDEEVVDPALLRCLGSERLRVVVSRRVQQPCVLGVLRPVILVPGAFLGWGVGRQRAVLRHEAAHVLRRDALSEFLVELGRSLWWPQPFAWWLGRDHRLLREHACDDAVLRDGGSATDYASELVQIARSLRPTQDSTPTGALAMVRPSDLETRVRALLRTDLQRLGPALWQRLGAGVLALAVTVFAGTAVAVAPQDPVLLPPPPVEELEEPEAPEGIELPPARKIDDGLVLFLDAKGVVRWNGTVISRAGLPQAVLAQLPEKGERHRVTLRVDEDVAVPELVATVDRLRSLGDKIDLSLAVGKPEARPILIAITAEGSVIYGGRKIGVAAVKPLVQRLLANDEARPVVIQADNSSKTAVVVRVVDAAKGAGARAVSLRTPQSIQGSKPLPKSLPDPLVIAVTAEGAIVYQGHDIGLEGVQPLVKRIATKNDSRSVVIQSSEDVPSGLLVRVIDELKAADPELKVSLAKAASEPEPTVDQAPKIVFQAKPKVTAAMRDHTVKVDVIFVVDETGKVRDAKVRQVVGNDLSDDLRGQFEKSSLEAIEKCRFKPGSRNGKKAPLQVRRRITFPGKVQRR